MFLICFTYSCPCLSKQMYILKQQHPNILHNLKLLLRLLKRKVQSKMCTKEQNPFIHEFEGQERLFFHSTCKLQNQMRTFEYAASTTDLDVQRTLSHLRNHFGASLYLQFAKYNDHQLFVDARSIKKFSSKPQNAYSLNIFGTVPQCAVSIHRIRVNSMDRSQ